MFAIYTYYDRDQIDQALTWYLGRAATAAETLRLYLHVALGGLLWHLWCQFKSANGEAFGDYPDKMLDYFNSFYPLILSLASKVSER